MRGNSRVYSLQEFDGGKAMSQMIQEKKSPNLTWMTGWCAALILFGIILMGGGFEATSAPTRLVYGLLGNTGQLDLNPPMRFTVAILGAVTIGWSLTLMAVIQAANQLEKRVSKFIWTGVTVSIVIWYVIDSSLSIATGFWLNAVSNTLISATFLIPVLRSGVLRS
jgi:hypothetical protein